MIKALTPHTTEAMNSNIQIMQCDDVLTAQSCSHSARGRQLGQIVFLFAYVMIMLLLIAHHEVSKDEVRAYSIARAANDPIDLVRNQLIDEGHPALWYLILWVGSKIWDNYAVLKIISFLVGVGLVSVVVLASPFPPLHRFLFAFGTFPFFWLSVYCRSYGLGALLIFLLAVEYTRKPVGSPWRMGGYNALLANTSVWGAIVACAFLVVPVDFTRGGHYSRRSWLCVVLGLTIVGLVVSVYTVSPTRENLVMDRKSIKSLQAGYANVGKDFIQATSAVLTDQLGWTGYILTGYGVRTKLVQLGYPLLASVTSVAGITLIIRMFVGWPRILLAFGSCFVMGGLFSVLVYPASSYHIAIIEAFLFALLWIVWSRHYRAHDRYWQFVTVSLGICLLCQASDGIRVAWGSLRKPFSSSAAAGAFLNRSYPGAVVICEPDAYGEALPYYADNPIYLIRERDFGRRVHFQKSFNRMVTLGEVIEASRRLKELSANGVLVALPQRIEEFKAGQFSWAYGRALKVSDEELRRFRHDFQEVGAFTEGLETYVFYKQGIRP